MAILYLVHSSWLISHLGLSHWVHKPDIYIFSTFENGFKFHDPGLCPFCGVNSLLGWHIRYEVAQKHCIEVQKSHLSDR